MGVETLERPITVICVQVLTPNIFARLFTFEMAHLKFQMGVGNAIVIEVQTQLLFQA